MFSSPNIALQRTPARGFIFSDSSGFVCGPSPLSWWSLDARKDLLMLHDRGVRRKA